MLRARSQPRGMDNPESRWLFLIDISGQEPRLFTQPIRTNARILSSTVIECGESIFAFCSLLSDHELRRGVAGWKLNKRSGSWEPSGFWYDTDFSKWNLEDVLDIHAIARGSEADVFFVVRRHRGMEYRHVLCHFCSAGRDVKELIELPNNFNEGSSAILAIQRH